MFKRTSLFIAQACLSLRKVHGGTCAWRPQNGDGRWK